MDIHLPVRCNVGGYEMREPDGRDVFQMPCPSEPAYRYRSVGAAVIHWSYRCTQHAEWLDRAICVIEPLAEVPS